MFSKKDLTNIEGVIMLYAVRLQTSKRNAAKYLNVSLDTLDKYIRILEEEIGVQVLTTSEKGCSLTAQGEKVVENIKYIKQCLDNLYTIKVSESDMKGEVHIVYDLNVRGLICAKAVQELYQQYPEITLCVDNVIGPPNMADIRYDISLSYEIPEGDDLVVIASRNIPCKFFATQEYLNINSYPKDLNDLVKNHHLIIVRNKWKDMSNMTHYKSKFCKGISFTNNESMVNDVAVNGGGIGMMPFYSDKMEERLVCLDYLDCPTNNKLYLVSHKSRKDIPKVRVVLNYYKKMIESL
ncbi:MAG: LysR family transcriptional regulator [Alphaproteobacteria bacterium]|nr:LysR family transcriptional regulator [Alphaproteobacteria bacterium]